MAKRNTLPIRVDTEIFIPELKIFREKNGLPQRMPEVTRELGKMLRELRIKEFKLQRDIIF